ncbi:MAG: hypothetical protein ACHQ15_08230, partial [Candidatus Limnocylindrales bacterium]
TGAWNVFERESGDAGRTFGATRQVSRYVPGYDYLAPDGFDLPYGDYFQMRVDTAGRTDVVWGEGPSYAGPGNIWFSQER